MVDWESECRAAWDKMRALQEQLDRFEALADKKISALTSEGGELRKAKKRLIQTNRKAVEREKLLLTEAANLRRVLDDLVAPDGEKGGTWIQHYCRMETISEGRDLLRSSVSTLLREDDGEKEAAALSEIDR